MDQTQYSIIQGNTGQGLVSRCRLFVTKYSLISSAIWTTVVLNDIGKHWQLCKQTSVQRQLLTTLHNHVLSMMSAFSILRVLYYYLYCPNAQLHVFSFACNNSPCFHVTFFLTNCIFLFTRLCEFAVCQTSLIGLNEHDADAVARGPRLSSFET